MGERPVDAFGDEYKDGGKTKLFLALYKKPPRPDAVRAALLEANEDVALEVICRAIEHTMLYAEPLDTRPYALLYVLTDAFDAMTDPVRERVATFAIKLRSSQGKFLDPREQLSAREELLLALEGDDDNSRRIDMLRDALSDIDDEDFTLDALDTAIRRALKFYHPDNREFYDKFSFKPFRKLRLLAEAGIAMSPTEWGVVRRFASELIKAMADGRCDWSMDNSEVKKVFASYHATEEFFKDDGVDFSPVEIAPSTDAIPTPERPTDPVLEPIIPDQPVVTAIVERPPTVTKREMKPDVRARLIGLMDETKIQDALALIRKGKVRPWEEGGDVERAGAAMLCELASRGSLGYLLEIGEKVLGPSWRECPPLLARVEATLRTWVDEGGMPAVAIERLAAAYGVEVPKPMPPATRQKTRRKRT